MKNINFHTILKTVRSGAFLGAVVIATTSTVFAAPVLGPVSAINITETSMTITANYSNPYKSTTVWIEALDKAGGTNAFSLHSSFNEGTFSATFHDLNPGQTYAFRSAAMEDGATVYSNIASFTTLQPKQGLPLRSPDTSLVGGEITAKAKNTPVAKQTVVAKEVAVAPAVAKEGFTNNASSANRNSASVIGAGSDMVPQTLIGWVLLLIVILLAMLLVKMIFESNEKHKKEDEADEHGEEK